MSIASDYVLTASAPTHPQLALRVHEWIADAGGQTGESRLLPHEGNALLRVAFAADPDPETLRDKFAPLGDRFAMRWQLRLARQRLLVLVSRPTYAGVELLGQWQAGVLGGDIVAVVSNHVTIRPAVQAAGVAFHHIPVEDNTAAIQHAESHLLELVDRLGVTTLVLARYMRIFSPWLCARLDERGIAVINLHHGDVAAFPGDHPYDQALRRGVTHIAATAHYATPELDQGPVIRQEWWPIPPAATRQDLLRLGRRGAAVLADAVRAHCEGRVVLTGRGTEIL